MSASSSWCCPFKPCGCLPRLSWLLPASCRAVHDWTHAFLLLAIVSGFSLTVRDVVVIYQTGCITNSHGHRTFCLVEVLDTMFLLPCTVQLAILIGAYGDRCHHISRAAAQRKLTQSYSTMIEEMDAQLQRFCESNVVLAERAFVDKRRDFLHFIEHCANIRAQVPGEDEEELLDNLKDIVRLWLRTYSEASIDPAGRPHELDPQGALDRCATLEDLTRTARDLVNVGRASVVTSARFREDLQTMARLRDDVACAVTGRRNRNLFGSRRSGGGAGGGSTITASAHEWEGRANLEAGVRELRRTLRLAQRQDVQERCCSWVRCCRRPYRCRCGIIGEEHDNECGIDCCCCGMTMISTDHCLILFAILVGVGLTVLNVQFVMRDFGATWMKSGWDLSVNVVPLVLYTLCLLFLLAKIESLSTLVLMKKHVQEMVQAQARVEQLREGLILYWSDVTDVTEFWLHRTIPRLDLMKEMHCHLISSNPSKWLSFMLEVNSRLQWLEDAVGEAGQWWEARREGHAQLLALGPRVDRILQTRTFMVMGEDYDPSAQSFSYKMEVLMGGFDMEFADEVCGVKQLAPSPQAMALGDVRPLEVDDTVWSSGWMKPADWTARVRSSTAYGMASDLANEIISPLMSLRPSEEQLPHVGSSENRDVELGQRRQSLQPPPPPPPPEPRAGSSRDPSGG